MKDFLYFVKWSDAEPTKIGQIFSETACFFQLTPPTRRGRFRQQIWLRFRHAIREDGL